MEVGPIILLGNPLPDPARRLPKAGFGAKRRKKEIGKRISEKNPACWRPEPSNGTGAGHIRFPISFFLK